VKRYKLQFLSFNACCIIWKHRELVSVMSIIGHLNVRQQRYALIPNHQIYLSKCCDIHRVNDWMRYEETLLAAHTHTHIQGEHYHNGTSVLKVVMDVTAISGNQI